MSMAVNFASDMSRNEIGILVLSADPNLRRTLLAALESADWMLYEAASGADALEKMEAGDQEVLLLDPVLPDLDLAEFKVIVQDPVPPSANAHHQSSNRPAFCDVTDAKSDDS